MAKNNYEKTKDTLQQARAAYQKLNTVSASKSALGSLRTIIKAEAKAVKLKKDRLEEEVKKVSETYMPSVAGPKIAALKTAFKNDLTAKQAALRNKLTETMKLKEGACQAYLMAVPSAEQISLLQVLKLRGAESISSEEWDMLAAQLAGNYQCACVLQSIAKDAGREFILPVTPADALEKLNLFRQRAEATIANITAPENNSLAYEFLSDYENTYTDTLIKELDTEIATTVPDASATLKGRLKAARDKALRAGDFDLFNLIADFIVNHSSIFGTENEQSQDFQEQAEALVTQGMAATDEKTRLKKIELEREKKRQEWEELAKKVTEPVVISAGKG